MIEIQISVFEMQVSLLPVNGNRQTLCQNDPCTKPFHFVCVCMGGGGGRRRGVWRVDGTQFGIPRC